MAASPKYKVFTARGEYVASFKHVDDAAAFVAIQGDGVTVRLGHSKRLTLWTEGRESRSAGDSYSAAAELMLYREDNPHEIPTPVRARAALKPKPAGDVEYICACGNWTALYFDVCPHCRQRLERVDANKVPA